MRGVPRTQSFADRGGLTGWALSAWALSCLVCMVKGFSVPGYGFGDTLIGLAWLSLLLLAGNRLAIGFCMASVFTDVCTICTAFVYQSSGVQTPPFIWELALGAALCFLVRNPDARN